MGKTAWDFVFEKMREAAKNDSTSAGGWEAVEDLARLKMNTQFESYVIYGLIEYLKTLPAPEQEKEL